jgi:hypothetical protein
VYIWRACF